MKHGTPPVGVGAITVVTVLLVLSFSVFSALTLTTARADLALSRTNAGTVSAWYAADSEAARLYAGFSGSDQPELDTLLPMNGAQSLHLHLVRDNGEVVILAWQAVPAEEAGLEEEAPLPVWNGETP